MPRTTPLPAPEKAASGIELVRRDQVLKATIAEFQGKPFRLGRADCARLFRAHAVRMGHRRLPAAPRYRTPDEARGVLAQMGASNLVELLDGFDLERIAPAAAWPGDIVALPGGEDGERDDGIGALGIVAQGMKILAWHPDCPVLAVADMAPGAAIAAWRL